MTAVRMEGVSRAFGDRYALRQVDLSVSRGEAIALTGPNGAGKTTLLRIVSTLLRPTSGLVEVLSNRCGENPSGIRRRIGTLFTAPSLYADLTLRENLDFFARLYDVAEAARAVTDWMERFGLGHLARHPVRNLSRGERQRASLIRSIMHGPELILWDEPASGLDEKGRGLLNDLAAKRPPGCTVLCATHDPGPISGWIQRTVSLKDGRIA